MNAAKFMKPLGALVLIASLCGCEKSPYEHLADARRELSDAAYAEALAAAEVGLEGDPEAATRWGLEVVKLEAQARSGLGEETKAQLQRLVGLHPNRVQSSEYFAAAQQLRTAGQGPAAIEVLDMGATFFPYDPVISRMIEESSAGSDPAELEMLRSLGYIE